MGIEVCREHEGAGLNFMSSIIAIEELARVDPAVSILCDIHVHTAWKRLARATITVYRTLSSPGSLINTGPMSSASNFYPG